MKNKIKGGILYKCFIPIGVYQNIRATDTPTETPEEKKDDGIDWKALWNDVKSGKLLNIVKEKVTETVTDMGNAIAETAKNVGNKIIEKVEEFTADMFIKAFKADPLKAINMAIYPIFQCNKNIYPDLHCGECITDEDTGIHYKQLGNIKSKRYIFFFHGMLYNLDSGDMDAANDYFKKNTEYNFINVEYISLTNEGVEKTYGLSQINKMSHIIYQFIKKFIENDGGDPQEIILCGHSHGNTYPTEILNLFVEENLYVDKLAYLGCKGYLDIEDVLFRAIQTVKKDEQYGEFVTKLFNRDITDKFDLITTLRVMFGKEIYNTIISENDINAKLSKILDKINVTNHHLRKEEHFLKNEDFEDMLQEYKKITDRSKGIPCLLFYADKDDYVGKEYSKPVKKLTTEEQTKSNEIKQNREEIFKKIDEIIDTEINKMDPTKKEAINKAHEKPTEAMEAQQSIQEIMERINSNNNNNNKQGGEQVTTTTKQRKCKCYRENR